MTRKWDPKYCEVTRSENLFKDASYIELLKLFSKKIFVINAVMNDFAAARKVIKLQVCEPQRPEQFAYFLAQSKNILHVFAIFAISKQSI